MASSWKNVKSWCKDSRVITLACLGAAISLAVGHHFFYQGLLHHDVDDRSSTQFSQKHNISIGTAFATSVKLFLGLAIGASYVQYLWYTLRRDQYTVEDIDSVSTLLSSALELLKWRLAYRFPVLVFLAAISYALFIVALFPPGSLSVVSRDTIQSAQTDVRTLDWANPIVHDTHMGMKGGVKWDGWNAQGTNLNETYYETAPRGFASQLALTTALAGEIPLIPYAYANSYYTLSFPGPALKCVSQTPVGLDYDMDCRAVDTHSGRNDLGYASWLYLPHTAGFEVGDIEQLNITDDGLPIDIADDGSDHYPYCYRIRGMAQNTTVKHSNSRHEIFIVSESKGGYLRGQTEWSLTNCKMFNTTYDVEFNIVNGTQQTLRVTHGRFEELRPVYESMSSRDGSSPWPSDFRIFNYLALLATMYKISGGAMSFAETEKPIPQILNTQLAFTQELTAFNNSAKPDTSDSWGELFSLKGTEMDHDI